MDGRRTMTAAELMDGCRDGLRRTAEAEARRMRREALAYVALLALGQACAVAAAVVLPRLPGVHRWVRTRRGGAYPERECVPMMGDTDILRWVSVKTSQERGLKCRFGCFCRGDAMLCER